MVTKLPGFVKCRAIESSWKNAAGEREQPGHDAADGWHDAQPCG